MNLNEFESRVKAGLSPLELSENLADQVGRRVRAVQQQKAKRKRVSFALATTGLAAIAMMVLPTVRVHAELNKLAGALDNVRSVIMTHETVDAAGNRTFEARFAYLDGRWKLDMPNRETQYFYDGTFYRLVPGFDHLVVDRGRKGPFGNNSDQLTLSSAVSDLKRWQPENSIEIDQTTWRGTQVTRASVRDRVSGGRTVIYADVNSDLPIEIDEEVNRSSKWQVVSVETFDYKTKQSVETFIPDLEKYPPVDQKEWAAMQVRDFTSKTMGEVKLNRGRLVVHRIDVGQDGTVFVTCQSGDRLANWDMGYPIDVSDDAGTVYTQLNIFSSLDQMFIDNSKDGKLELCVFVPVVPIQSWSPKTLHVTARLRSSRKLVKHDMAIMFNRQGISTSNSWNYDVSQPVEIVDVASEHVDKPLPYAVPGYVHLITPALTDHATDFPMLEAKARADYYRTKEDVSDETFWLNETIRISPNIGAASNARRRLEELRQRTRP